MKPPCPGLFVSEVLITNSILTTNQFVQIFISSDSVLVLYMFPGIYPYILGCQIYWYIFVHSSLYEFLYFHSISRNGSSFISDFESSPLFLLILAKVVSILTLQRASVSYINLFYCVLDSISFICSLIFVISFLLTTLGFFPPLVSSNKKPGCLKILCFLR